METEHVSKTLGERGKHYEGPGGYVDTARTAQAIKDIVRGSHNVQANNLTPVMLESLDMIANKVSRILNGNPNHADTWHDIAGYATLAEKSLLKPVVADKQGVHWQPTRPFDERWDSHAGEINLIDY